MNIQSINSQKFHSQNTTLNSGNQIINKTVNPFGKEFNIELPKQEKTVETQEALEKMLEDINQLKENLDFDLTVENVMEYKKLVKSFLQFYTENALQTQDVIYRNGRHNEKLTIVKKIGEGIEELDDAMSLLDTRRGHLDMLQKIGEINGMILNLRL